MVEPQACSSSATQTSSARGSAVGELAQILLLAGLPGALGAAAVVLGLERVPGDREGDGPELVRDLPLERRAAVGAGLLQHVMQDAADDGHLLAAVAGEDDRDVGRVGKIVHPGPAGRRRPVVFRREGERVVDPVGITVHGQRGRWADRQTGRRQRRTRCRTAVRCPRPLPVSRNSEKLMRLEAQSPARMGQAVAQRGGGVGLPGGAVHRLEEEMIEAERLESLRLGAVLRDRPA